MADTLADVKFATQVYKASVQSARLGPRASSMFFCT